MATLLGCQLLYPLIYKANLAPATHALGVMGRGGGRLV